MASLPCHVAGGAKHAQLERVKETPPSLDLEGHDGVATQPSVAEELSMSTIAIGVDLAKH